MGVVLAKFPSLRPVDGDFAYWLDAFRRYSLARRAQAAISQAIQGMIGDPENSIASLEERLGALRAVASVDERPPSFGENAINRLAAFDRRTEFFADPNQIYGIPTPFETINSTRMGWLPGELALIFSRPTVGKSWFLALAAVVAWMAKYRVLVLSPEMPVSQYSLRFDVLAATALGERLSLKLLTEGSPLVRETYARVVERIKADDRLTILDGIGGRPFRLSDMRGLINRYQPDMMFIDGLSLVGTDSRNQQVWEQIRELSYGLKNLATNFNMPIMVSHQSVNSRRGARTDNNMAQGRGDDWNIPTLNDLAFGDAAAQAINTCIAMAPDKRSADIRWVAFRKCRDREIEYREREAFFTDFGRGRVVDLGRLGGDMPLITQEVNRLVMAS
jgi:hypothetical protein